MHSTRARQCVPAVRCSFVLRPRSAAGTEMPVMGTPVQHALRLLQAAGCARALLTCAGLSPQNALLNGPSRFELECRLENLDQQLTTLLLGMTREQRERLRLERALFLRLLQESAG